MAETYVVNYDINVQSQQALNAFRQFQEATVQLQACMKPLEDFRRKVSSINTALNNMAKKAPVMNISTAKATEKLDAVLAKMERIHAMVRQMPPLNIAAAGAGTKKTASGGTSGQGTSGSNTVITGGGGTKGSGKAGTPAKAPAAGNVKTPVAFYGGGKGIPQNIGYRAFGQSMIDSGGVGAFSMMKGMGISYGIMGIGSLMGSAIKESVEYDNLMQTTRNILQTHDKYANFDERFKGMERTVRNVGVETKFTAAQVADASRFLAMAGFDVEGINKTIRPIADVALIGDTDLGATADVVTNIMTGYNIKPDEVRKAADILTMTFTKTNTELMDLAEAYKYSANLLNAGGISFEEATAGLGILGNVGMQGSQAGTTMRTIMANLVKPTKAQGKMWDKLGIERLDASGNVRALTDIFRDLSEAGVTLEDVYRMFHRTAAQGAMALVNNIEKWEEIEYLNSVSAGLSARLAEEKKNTTLGLWYQLTSSFTEGALQAFENMEGSVKSLLRESTAGLQTPEAINQINGFSRSIFSLVVMLKDTGLRFLDLYNYAQPLIHAWMWFQVQSMPFLLAARALRSLGTAILSLGVAARSSFGLMSNVFVRLRNLGTTVPVFGWGASMKNLFAPNSKHVDFVGAKPNPGVRRRNVVAGGAGAGLLGGVGGAILGERIAGNYGAIVGGIGGAWIAGSAGTLLAGLSGPVGLSLLGAGVITAGIYAWKKYHEKIDECTEANNNFIRSTRTVNGLNMSKGATTFDKYLSIVYNKQLSVNQAVGAHLALVAKQIGIVLNAENLFEKGAKWGDTDKEGVEAVKGAAKNSESKITAPWYDDKGNLDPLMQISTDRRMYQDLRGYEYANTQKHYFFQGTDMGDGADGKRRAVLAQHMFAAGRSTAEGSAVHKIMKSYNKDLFKSISTADFDAVRARYNSVVDKMEITKGSKTFLPAEAEGHPQQKNAYFVAGAQLTIRETTDLEANESPWAKQMNTFREMLELRDAHKPIPDELVEKFLYHSGVDLFNFERFGGFDSPKLLEAHGYWDNQWHAGTYEIWNETLQQFEKQPLSAQEAETAFKDWRSYIGQIVDMFDVSFRQVFLKFRDHEIFNLKSFTPPKQGDVEGEYMYDFDEKKVLAKRKMTDREFAAHYGQDRYGNPLETDPVTGKPILPPPGSGKGGKGDPNKDFQSHYKSESAAPKQINVKIDSLLNVKSIDLTNPNNVAVIDDLKSQLAQALIDVVHDFDASFHD